MSKNHQLSKDEMSKGGKNGKRKPFDVELAEMIETYLSEHINDEPRKLIMVKAAFKEFLGGNSKPMQYLIDRGFKMPTKKVESEISVDIPNAQINMDGKPIADSDN